MAFAAIAMASADLMADVLAGKKRCPWFNAFKA